MGTNSVVINSETSVAVIDCDLCGDVFAECENLTFEEHGTDGVDDWKARATKWGWVFGSFGRSNHALCPWCVVIDYIDKLGGVGQFSEGEITK